MKLSDAHPASTPQWLAAVGTIAFSLARLPTPYARMVMVRVSSPVIWSWMSKRSSGRPWPNLSGHFHHSHSRPKEAPHAREWSPVQLCRRLDKDRYVEVQATSYSLMKVNVGLVIRTSGKSPVRGDARVSSVFARPKFLPKGPAHLRFKALPMCRPNSRLAAFTV